MAISNGWNGRFSLRTFSQSTIIKHITSTSTHTETHKRSTRNISNLLNQQSKCESNLCIIWLLHNDWKSLQWRKLLYIIAENRAEIIAEKSKNWINIFRQILQNDTRHFPFYGTSFSQNTYTKLRCNRHHITYGTFRNGLMEGNVHISMVWAKAKWKSERGGGQSDCHVIIVQKYNQFATDCATSLPVKQLKWMWINAQSREYNENCNDHIVVSIVIWMKLKKLIVMHVNVNVA